ncbi:TFB5-like protein [Glarea lozoyensis ATCC 20868]|uniref:General transcription and DNA repair factor IIH subunit TFB5 n=1 Tax=Glarea lozoyensis (strain ATCC 20868 / MF5171) TaxID=1116229 RepID=S3D0J1_GLAL2|nr:TFB5-like protein [Glarea lozoyensis ATCC 20868]EPE30679.1 TFB5-like protein [Glarea lozoyensis ATCC 20868]
MVKAVIGILVQCDPSIKAIIMSIDAADNQFVVEELDDQTLVIKESQLSELKRRLDEQLKDTQQPPEDSGSD